MSCLRRTPLWQLALEQVSGGAAAGDLAPARAHLASGCERCNRRLSSYLGILGAVRSGPLPEPGADLLGRARRLADPAVAALGEWLAQPLPWPAAQPALRGLRISSERRLYRAGPYEVDLALMDNGTLVGQVWARDPATPTPGDGACVLFSDGEPIVVPIESNGDFRIPSPPPGPYSLCLEVRGARIVVEGALSERG
jgi:hypothetical protein